MIKRFIVYLVLHMFIKIEILKSKYGSGTLKKISFKR